jgi:hypothetical protein
MTISGIFAPIGKKNYPFCANVKELKLVTMTSSYKDV